jgi:hypothetical protein
MLFTSSSLATGTPRRWAGSRARGLTGGLYGSGRGIPCAAPGVASARHAGTHPRHSPANREFQLLNRDVEAFAVGRLATWRTVAFPNFRIYPRSACVIPPMTIQEVRRSSPVRRAPTKHRQCAPPPVAARSKSTYGSGRSRRATIEWGRAAAGLATAARRPAGTPCAGQVNLSPDGAAVPLLSQEQRGAADRVAA